MSDVTLPSWRVRPRERSGWGISRRVWMIGGGLLASVALAGGIVWGVSKLGPRGVPVIEADGRPFKVRPDSPGGAVVPNQQELIFERGAARNDRPGEARLSAGPETPRPEALRAQAAPGSAAPPTPAPAAPAVASVAPAQQASRPAPPAATPQGRVQVQMMAARTEEIARAEWDRLARRVPELAGRAPAISRLDRPDGQPPLFRLRTGGFADQPAARAFCEQVKAGGGACVVVGG